MRSGKRPVAKPLAELFSVSGVQQFHQRPEASAESQYARLECQEVKVVISEYGNHGVTQAFDEAQSLERFWTTIDKVARQPERVFSRVEVDFIKQSSKRVVATLQITYRIYRHGYGA